MTKAEMIDVLRGKVLYDSPEEIQYKLNEIAEYMENCYSKEDMDAIDRDRKQWQQDWYRLANELWWKCPQDGELPKGGDYVLIQVAPYEQQTHSI